MRYTVRFRELDLDRAAVDYIHDAETVRSEAVHTSQIGFRADDPAKCAFLSIWLGTGGAHSYPQRLRFSLIEAGTGERVYTGKVNLAWSVGNPEEIGGRVNHNRTDVYRMDFGDFGSPGRYRACVEGVGCGYPFEIGTDVWKRVFRISMRGFYHQRIGIALLPPLTDFIRPRAFHPLDGLKVYQSTCPLLYSGNGLNALGTEKNNFDCLVAGKTGEIVPDVWGGYADAADWDRRIQHLFATRLHLELMELFPEFFKALSLNVSESRNELPDLMDEALFDLEVYRRLQMQDGGVRGGLESSEHPNLGETSWQDSLTLMAYAPDCWSSYIYAGVAARAAFMLRALGSGSARMYEESALRAIGWAEVEYEKWKRGPDYAKATERARSRIPVERNLAAVELYRLTHDKRWHEVFRETFLEVSGLH
jgi:endoglucanase